LLQSNFFLISSEQQHTHIVLLLYHREGREREREKGEKLFAAFPSHRKNHLNETKKRERLIERITTTTREKRIVVVKSNSARIQEK